MSQFISSAKLQSFPSSPKKMRLVADIIRNKSVSQAISILKATSKQPATPLSKLIFSALSNLRVKYDGYDIDEDKVFIKSISVDGAGFFKRLRTAPQGRAHRIRKRSNHVSVVLSFDMSDQQQIDKMKKNDIAQADVKVENQKKY